jgi:hypothetical protein
MTGDAGPRAIELKAVLPPARRPIRRQPLLHGLSFHAHEAWTLIDDFASTQ